MSIYIITQEEQNKTNLALCQALNVQYTEIPSGDILIDAQQKFGTLKGFKWSEESKKTRSNSKKGLFCYYDPTTFQESWHRNAPEGLIKGRNPNKIHGGKIGIYNAERSRKISEVNKGRQVWNKNKTHSDDTKIKMSNSAKMRPLICCTLCKKEIKGSNNFMQHIRGRH